MSISSQTIQQLAALPIEEVAERLGLEPCRHRSLCPFHEDHHASLTYDRRRNRYHCFACGAHGQTIDLVRHQLHCGFVEACQWLADKSNVLLEHYRPAPPAPPARLDLPWLRQLVAQPRLNAAARHFLFDERRLHPAVVRWCGISSIDWSMPMDSRLDGPCFDGPALLLPYRAVDGTLLSVQSRYLGDSSAPANGSDASSGAGSVGTGSVNQLFEKSGSRTLSPLTRQPALHDVQAPQPATQAALAAQAPQPAAPPSRPLRPRPRFRFPAGSRCGIYNLPVLALLRPGEALYVAEGVSDCLALLSAGHKAVAIPSATLLQPADRSLLQGIDAQFHMYPDQDEPGECLFLQLRDLLPAITRHPLPPSCKDYGDYWRSQAAPNGGDCAGSAGTALVQRGQVP